MFSKTCEYAIRALVFIAKNSLNDTVVQQREISVKLESPDAFTAKIVQQLSKNKFVLSMRGPTGGYYITTENMKKINMIDIVKVFDGPDVLNRCVLGLSQCPGENPCAFHDKYMKIREKLNSEMLNCSLYDVAKNNKTVI